MPRATTVAVLHAFCDGSGWSVNLLLNCSGGSSGEASEAEPHLSIVQKRRYIYYSYNSFQSTLRILYSII